MNQQIMFYHTFTNSKKILERENITIKWEKSLDNISSISGSKVKESLSMTP